MVNERDEKGRFVKGVYQNPQNTGGRPKGLAQRAREATHDGADIITFYVETAQDKTLKRELRMQAYAWLAERGWGKPQEYIEHSGDPDQPVRMVVEIEYIDHPAKS